MKKSSIYLVTVSLLIDMAAVFSGMLIAYRLRSGGEDLFNWPFERYLQFILWLLPLWAVMFASQGLYNSKQIPRGWNALSRTLIALIAGWGMTLIILYLWRSPEAQTFPRLIIIYGIIATSLLAVTGKLLTGALVLGLYRSGRGIIQTVIIGNGENDHFADALERNRNDGRQVLARLTADNWQAKLEELRQATKFDEIFVTKATLAEGQLLDMLNWAEANNYSFTAVPSFLSVRATNVEIASLAGTPVMYFLRTPLEGWGRVYKRLLDLVLVIPALIILSPVLLLLTIIIYISSPGSVIFKQERVGQDGKRFFIHKFRSMYANWQQKFPNVQDWSADEKSDPRITRIGRFIRKTSLDELPQLLDILVGTMSIVGPRPEQPKYVEKFAQELPDYIRRHHVKSGLTGWAQVNGLRGDTSISERVKYDLFYIENWSIWFDIRIIISTFIYVIRQGLGIEKR